MKNSAIWERSFRRESLMKKPVLVGILIVARDTARDDLLQLQSGEVSRGSLHDVSRADQLPHGALALRRSSRGASATTNACAAIAAGVTDSIACENTPPIKVTCEIVR